MLRGTADEPLLAAEDPWDEALLQRVARRIGRQPIACGCDAQALHAEWLGEPATPAAANADRHDGAMHAPTGRSSRFVDQALSRRLRGRRERRALRMRPQRRDGQAPPRRRDDALRAAGRRAGAQEVISRIKVLAQLDITERRLPQDGRFRFDARRRADRLARVDHAQRVRRGRGAAPARQGAAALAATRPSRSTCSASSASDAQLIRELAGAAERHAARHRPDRQRQDDHACTRRCREINTGLEKIITIEDPVEYELPGVLQIPVNERKGLTFAKGLRSILRHDPDRILVGEIRDAETAEIAVQSALTGPPGVHHGARQQHGRHHRALPALRARHVRLHVVAERRGGAAAGAPAVPALRGRRRDRNRSASGMAGAAWAQPTRARVPSPVGLRAMPRRRATRGASSSPRCIVVDDALRDHVTERRAGVGAARHMRRSSGVEPLPAQAARHVARGRTTLEEVKRVVGWH